MKVLLDSLGCRLNEAELEQWAHAFACAGDSLVADVADADVMVLNTCAVTQEAVAKSRRRIARMQRENPAARLVVSGCFTALESPSELAELGIDLVVSNRDKAALVKQTRAAYADPSMPESATLPAQPALYQRNRHRAFVKIQDGCRHRCTYCIVTVARGAEQSRDIDDLVTEVNRLVSLNIREVVLTGVHVGGYGTDLGLELADLVEALLVRTRIERIRFASVEPWDLSHRFIDLFSEKRLMPHMHLPLQSGSDPILKRMARRCRTREFAQLTDALLARAPEFNITTDVIVGFPGESEALWKDSLSFIADMPFGHIHIFTFSAREGTAAAGFADQIPVPVRQERSRELHELANSLTARALKDQLGVPQQVLWERGKPIKGDSSRLQFKGYTENYHRMMVESDEPLSNQITTLTPEQIEGNLLLSSTQGSFSGRADYPLPGIVNDTNETREPIPRNNQADADQTTAQEIGFKVIPLVAR